MESVYLVLFRPRRREMYRSMNIESQLQARLLLAAPASLPQIRFFRRNVGTAAYGQRKVQFGIKGQCDLYGILRGGQLIEVELKGPGKKIKPGSDQEHWQEWCREWRVPHVVLTALIGEHEDVTVTRWIQELDALIKSV